jgi:hypothetical protein
MAATITCPANGTGVCDLLGEAGAGLGLMFQYLGQALPSFLLVLAVIGGVIAIVMALAGVIKGSMHSYTGRRGR